MSRRSIIASMQQSVEKLAAGQETMARDIARLQAAEKDIRHRISVPPPQPAAAPAHKPVPATTPEQPAPQVFSGPASTRSAAPSPARPDDAVAATDANALTTNYGPDIHPLLWRAYLARACQRSLDAVLAAEKPKHLISAQIVVGCNNK